MAGGIITFINDTRTITATLHKYANIVHHVASIKCYMGARDAARKRREPSPTQNMWCVSIVETIHGQLLVITSKTNGTKVD